MLEAQNAMRAGTLQNLHTATYILYSYIRMTYMMYISATIFRKLPGTSRQQWEAIWGLV